MSASARLGTCALIIALVLDVLTAPVGAQDTRTVSEPGAPAPCSVLRAQLTPMADSTLAKADERRLDTKRIQSAIDGCTPGHAVVLQADGGRRAFLAGPLELRGGVTLVVGEGAILFGSRDPRLYDVAPGRCGVVDSRGHGCRALINADHAAGAGVMGPGTIDGRGRARLLGQDVSWWDLAQQAKVEKRYQSSPRLLVLEHANDFTLYRVRLRNAGNFHVFYERGNGFTAWGVVIDTRDPRARNTDGIDPASSSNVTITRSFINTGDDNVAIKAGSTGPSTHISITHNHFYRGHGVSIGSETNGGVSAIRVSDLSIDGADNGLRIKSNAARGGLVHDVEYRDVCIQNTGHPIAMDTHYTASAQTTGTLIPQFRDIHLVDVRVLGGGRVILDGHDRAHPLGISFDNVVFDAPRSVRLQATFVNAHVGPGPMNLPISGEDVRVSGAPGEAPANACTGKFVPMPTASAR